MFLCNFTKCLSYQHESTKLLLRYKLSKVNTFILRQVLCSVCSTARKSCFGSTGWHLGMIMLSDWIVPIELHRLKHFLNQASDYCLNPSLQHGTPHVCFNLLYLPHIRIVWAHKSCLRNEYSRLWLIHQCSLQLIKQTGRPPVLSVRSGRADELCDLRLFTSCSSDKSWPEFISDYLSLGLLMGIFVWQEF